MLVSMVYFMQRCCPNHVGVLWSMSFQSRYCIMEYTRGVNAFMREADGTIDYIKGHGRVKYILIPVTITRCTEHPESRGQTLTLKVKPEVITVSTVELGNPFMGEPVDLQCDDEFEFCRTIRWFLHNTYLTMYMHIDWTVPTDPIVLKAIVDIPDLLYRGFVASKRTYL